MQKRKTAHYKVIADSGGNRYKFFCDLTGADVVRHQLVQKIIEAYEVYDKKNPPEPVRKKGTYKRKKQ